MRIWIQRAALVTVLVTGLVAVGNAEDLFGPNPKVYLMVVQDNRFEDYVVHALGRNKVPILLMGDFDHADYVLNVVETYPCAMQDLYEVPQEARSNTTMYLVSIPRQSGSGDLIRPGGVVWRYELTKDEIINQDSKVEDLVNTGECHVGDKIFKGEVYDRRLKSDAIAKHLRQFFETGQ